MSNNSQEVITEVRPKFFNQHSSFESKYIGNRACGPTALAMAINLVHQHDPIFQQVDPRSVLLRAAHMTELPLNEKHFYLVAKGLKENGMKDYIPIGNKISIKDRELISREPELEIEEVHDLKNNAEWGYGPIYTTNNGLDHRGAGALLETYDIVSEKFGDPKEKRGIKKVARELQKGNMILASVNHTEDSSHIILIAGYQEQNGEWLLVYDPDSNGPQWLEIGEIEKIFRGYGTLIYNYHNKNGEK